MPAKPKFRTTLLALVALCATAIGPSAAHAADARYEGVSEDGDVAVFSTTDKLVSGDTDIQSDVYVREAEAGVGYVTREASLGPIGGNDAFAAQFLAIDPAGQRVFFSTRERLTAADQDSATDIYVRDLELNETTLVSAGAASCASSGCGNANVDAGAVADGVVDAGEDVFFVSAERLAPGDGDESPDVYLRDLEVGTTTLVSAAGTPCAGSCGNGAKPASFQGASADGGRVIFTTGESLVIADADADSDLYLRDLASGETRLVSSPGTGPEPCPAGKKCEPVNSHISSNGAHVFFETNERVAAGDSDAFQDVYDWTGGAPARVSTGPAGGNGEANALFGDSSATGDEVFFTTVEPLVGGDGDTVEDVYVRSDGTGTELVSAGDPSCAGSNCGNGAAPAALEWVSADGSLAVLSSVEPLTAADGDARADVYTRALPGGPTVLVSVPGPTCTAPGCGNEPHNASFAGASATGDHLFFVSDEALVPPAAGDSSGPGDRDAQTDVHDRSGGTTTLVSAGQLTGSGPYSGNGPHDSQLQGASADGAKAFIVTEEQLTAEDSDVADDVYMRAAGGTLLVSRSNDAELEAELAPPGPLLQGTDPESPAASTSPKVYGLEPVEASIKIYATPNCTGEPIGTGSDKALAKPGIQVTVATEATTAFRATAEADGFVSPCSGELSYTQEDEWWVGGDDEEESEPKKSPAGPGPLIRLPYLVPETRITFGPAFKTRARRPTFRFTDATGQSGTDFECRIDRARWKDCSSPIRLKSLDRGRHVFAVLGVNADGVYEGRPVKRKFKVVTR